MASAATPFMHMARGLIQQEVDMEGLVDVERRCRIQQLSLRCIRVEDEYVVRRLREIKEGSLYEYVIQEGREAYRKKESGSENATLLIEADAAVKERIKEELSSPAVFMQAHLDFEALEEPAYKGVSRIDRAAQLAKMLAVEEILRVEASLNPPFQGRSRAERTFQLLNL